MGQRLASGFGQERREDDAEDEKQADDGRRWAIAAERHDQGAGDQRADAGDPAKVATPQNPKVTDSIIKNAAIRRGRTLLSTNMSVIVKPIFQPP
jgi:hypothetical protein